MAALHIKMMHRLNKIFGKKILFIEMPTLTSEYVIAFVKRFRVRKCFCLSPIDYKQCKYPELTNQTEFEKACYKLYPKLNEMCIVVLHIHLAENCSYEEAKRKVERTLEMFKEMGIETNEIYPGWDLMTDVFKKVCNELNLHVSKKQWRYYDFWIKDIKYALKGGEVG
jgi:hypothetical protein